MPKTQSQGSPTATDIARAIGLRSQEAFAVRLGPRAFFLAWLGIYFLHAVCGLYYVSAGVFFLWSRELFVLQFFDAWNTIVRPRYFLAIAIVHLTVGGVHAGFLFYPLLWRVYRMAKRRFKSSNSRFQSVARFASVLPQSLEQRIHPLLRSTARRLYGRVFGHHGFLSIESRQFDGLLLVREIFETAVQSYQAYQLSQHLYRRRLIRLYVATLVFNCWITPVLHYTIKHRPLQRLLDRLLDVLLDFTASVGVPLVVVWSYSRQFDLATRDFPGDLYADLAWSITARNESPIVLFGSWVDTASRLIFFIGLLLSLDDVKLLLCRESSRKAVHPRPTKKKKRRHPPVRAKRSRVLEIGHRLLFVYGFAVLAVHVQTNMRDRGVQLLQRSSAPGTAAQFEDVVGHLYWRGVIHLSFRHCHAIEIQPSLQKFHNLSSITFYNTTILRWGADAALTNTHHPSIFYAYFARTRFPEASLPGGLSSYDFPRLPIDLQFSVTNLVSLPEDLDKRWASEMSLNIEFSELTEFPLAFTRMKMVSLMLAGNRIREVPAAAFANEHMFLFSTNGNPVSTLLDDVDADAVHAFMISLYATNLTSVPEWIPTLVANGKYISAGRTPYCEDQLLLDANSTPPDPEVWLQAIDCVDTGPVTTACRCITKASAVSVAPARADSVVALGPVAYTLCWTGVHLIHAVCVAYCVAAGALLASLPGSNMGFYLDFAEATLPSSNFTALAIVHYVVAALHGATLVYDATRQSRQTLGQVLNRRQQNAIAAVYKHTFTRQGLLGVEFQHFESFVFAREVVETVLQSHQAYHMCRLLTWQRLNRFFVATLVVNCWTTPLVHHFVATKPLRRLLLRACDIVLDLFAVIVVPVILVVGYVRAYDPTIQDFPNELWYADAWFTTALNECPLIFFGSWLAAASRLVFLISLLSSLDGIKALICRAKPRKKELAPTSLVPVKPRHSRVLSMGHWLMFAYGVGVLGVHLQAELRPAAPPACALTVRPWLISRPACAHVEVNCFRNRSLSGNASDFRRIFSNLDAGSLSQITFRHCAFVEFQQPVQQLYNLIGIKLYNSTLESWDVDAALAQAHHPKMRFLFVVRTTLANATLLLGLMDRDFPFLLRDAEFVATNFHSFPSDLNLRWPPAISLVLEYNGLTEYPPMLALLGLQALSLTGNQITTMPAQAFEAPGCNAIAVRGNPMRRGIKLDDPAGVDDRRRVLGARSHCDGWTHSAVRDHRDGQRDRERGAAMDGPCRLLGYRSDPRLLSTCCRREGERSMVKCKFVHWKFEFR